MLEIFLYQVILNVINCHKIEKFESGHKYQNKYQTKGNHNDNNGNTGNTGNNASIFNFEFLVVNLDYDNSDDSNDLNDDSGTNLYGCKVKEQLMVVGSSLIFFNQNVCV